MGGVGDAAVDESAGGVAGGGRALGQQPDLDRLRGPAEALRARLLAVLGPAKPAEVRRVDAVPDVVGVGRLAREPQADGLERLAAAGRPAGALGPVLPAKVGDVRAGLDRAGDRGVPERDPERLHAEPAAGRARDGALAHRRQPAEVPHVGRVADRIRKLNVRSSRSRVLNNRRRRPILNNNDLNRIYLKRGIIRPA